MKRGQMFLVFVILLVLISFVYAQDIKVEYPKKVKVGEEFKIRVEMEFFQEGTYDVKVDLTDNDGKRIGKIKNEGEWKSTYYYVEEIVKANEKEFFSLLVEDYIGTANMEIKFRNSDTKEIHQFRDYKIEFFENKETTDSDKGDIKSEETTDIETDDIEDETESAGKEDSGVIKITGQTIKTETDSETGDKSNLTIYALIVFAVVIIALVVFKFRAGRYKKNEFNE